MCSEPRSSRSLFKALPLDGSQTWTSTLLETDLIVGLLFWYVTSYMNFPAIGRDSQPMESSKKDKEVKDAAAAAGQKGQIPQVSGTERPAEEKTIWFRCAAPGCGLSERCHYFGRNPPFVSRKRLVLEEDAFVMRDPFRGDGKNGLPLILGGKCRSCGKVVCVGCSTFYSARFCDDCALGSLSEFPAEVGVKVSQKKTASVGRFGT